MHNLNDFKTVVGDLISFLEDFNKTEAEKLDAVQHNRVTFVEESMKKEQAAIMKLRGLDKKRESIQKDLGWEGMSFQQILSQVNDVEREELRPLFDQLNRSLHQFLDTKDSAQKALEINLHHIDKLLKKKAAEENGAYNSNGSAKKPEKPGRHFTNRKI